MSSYNISVQLVGTGVVSTISENELDYTLNVVNVIYTSPAVTSVGVSGGATGLTVSNSPITTSGVMTIGGILAVEQALQIQVPLDQILMLRKQSQAGPQHHLADLTGTSIFNTLNLWPTM